MSIHLQNEVNALKARVQTLEASVAGLFERLKGVSASADFAVREAIAPHDEVAQEIINGKRRRIADDTD